MKHAETLKGENHMTDHVISNDTRWQNVLLYKFCYHYAGFGSTSDIVRRTKLLLVLIA